MIRSESTKALGQPSDTKDTDGGAAAAGVSPGDMGEGVFTRCSNEQSGPVGQEANRYARRLPCHRPDRIERKSILPLLSFTCGGISSALPAVAGCAVDRVLRGFGSGAGTEEAAA